jgi:hypothetical protein
MKSRNLLELANTKEFMNLINTFNLKFKIHNGNIILSNGYIYIWD